MIHVFILMCFCLLVGVFGDEVKSVSVMEGDSVTLYTNIKLQSKDEIEWKFEKIRIARIKRSVNINPIYEDNGKTQRFRDRLKMNNQTADLIISVMRSEHTGLYTLFKGDKAVKSFILTAYARLPIPFISGGISHCSSSNCVLLCSVLNVRDVSLSWYKENRLLPIISESKPNIISISFQLDVKYQNNNTYSCVVSNSVSNRTQDFCLADLCQPYSCHRYHYLLKLAYLAGGVIVLSLIVLVSVIKSRRNKLKGKSQTSSATPVKSSSSLSQSP